jgi:hypothetical protein
MAATEQVDYPERNAPDDRKTNSTELLRQECPDLDRKRLAAAGRIYPKMSVPMRKRIAASMTLAVLGLAACKPPAPQPPPPAPRADTSASSTELGEPADPRFIGRIWISTTPGHARGSIMIFLPDRTLLMDSCFETYRISQWGAEGDRIRWVEDAIPIEATVSLPSGNELRLQLAGQDRVQSFVAASEPYVCPSMPR